MRGYYKYIYQYKDHLGNTRVSYAKKIDESLEITDKNDYYPFGLNHIGGLRGSLGGYKNYKYNGKELQETGMYDYGWRQYMPDIARWYQIDPLAERDRRWSPYRYAYDNPLRFIDPDGLWEIEVKEREIMKKGKGTGKMQSYISFVAQEGDNINTLAEQTGLDLDQLTKGLEGVEIKEGTNLDKLGIKKVDKIIDTINNHINNQSKAGDSNCWGTSVSVGKYGFVNFNIDNQGTGIIPDPNRADEILQNGFKQTDKPAFGDIRRYAYPDGNKRFTNIFNQFGYNIVENGNKAGGTSHYATYLLNNGAGTVYVFSKNGAGEDGKWVVTPEKYITGDKGYGNPTPIGTGSSDYSRK